MILTKGKTVIVLLHCDVLCDVTILVSQYANLRTALDCLAGLAIKISTM